MKQSRISMLETPGAANVTLGTLSSIAAAFKVGLVVKFVPFSEMLAWENNFSQDQFDVVKIDDDTPFLRPELPAVANTAPMTVAMRPPAAQFVNAARYSFINTAEQMNAFGPMNIIGSVRITINGSSPLSYQQEREEDILWANVSYQNVTAIPPAALITSAPLHPSGECLDAN
jgi:hypothetical protein